MFIHKLQEKTAMTVWIAEAWHMQEHYFHGCGIAEIKGALIPPAAAAEMNGTFKTPHVELFQDNMYSYFNFTPCQIGYNCRQSSLNKDNIIHYQYDGCQCTGDVRRHNISTYDIDLIFQGFPLK